MFFKKIMLILSFTFILCFYNIYNNKNETDLDAVALVNEKDIQGPVIKNVSPDKYQQYIVSKPTIKISYSDENAVDTSSIKLYVNYKDVTSKSILKNNKIIYTPDKKLKRGNQIVRLEISDINKNKTEFEWYFTVGTPIYNHYYGLLHSHTSASDGHGTYDDAYYMAKYKANLDFFAITEHSNLLDNDLKCNINNGSYSNEWTVLIKSRDKFNLKDKFIALNGFEMTYPFKVENKIGHINIFNSDGFVSTNLDNMTLDNFYKLISEQDDLIGQFNHPGDKFGDFNNLKYSKSADEVISLIEVCNGYNKDNSKNILSFNKYQLALDNGWHVAPTANQDNHKVDFGIANEFRTVILSTELSKDSLYDSLKKMRVYATQDKNIRIDYSINELPLGSTITNATKLSFSICAIDNDYDDKIKKIQVISNNGEIIQQKDFNSNLAKLEFNIKPLKNKFYYVKVIQNNDKVSVTAPIWIK